MDEEFEAEQGELDDEEDTFLPSRPLRLIDLILLPICFLAMVAEAASETLNALARILKCHANHLTDQEDFREEARLSIEMLPTQED